MPASFSLTISSDCRGGGQPRSFQRPVTLGFSDARRWYSSMTSRSAWPSAPTMVSINPPVAVLVNGPFGRRLSKRSGRGTHAEAGGVG